MVKKENIGARGVYKNVKQGSEAEERISVNKNWLVWLHYSNEKAIIIRFVFHFRIIHRYKTFFFFFSAQLFEVIGTNSEENLFFKNTCPDL